MGRRLLHPGTMRRLRSAALARAWELRYLAQPGSQRLPSDWRADAACRRFGLGWFSTDHTVCRQVCRNECPVLGACLAVTRAEDDAADLRSISGFGTSAGLSGSTRMRLQSERRA